jgi:acetylornithine deacetylase/succinyl-diaminopimelate desuccinylase-like protein
MISRIALALLLLSAGAVTAAAQDPVIETLVARSSIDRLHDDVASLVDFQSRRVGQPGELWAQDFVFDRFAALGFTGDDLYLQSFSVDGDNVVAVLPGVVNPDEIHVIGAHYDSINTAGAAEPAPGANDNASGTSGVLEIARLVAESGIRFEATIHFVAFAAEEVGLVGSEAYVDEAFALGQVPATAIVMDTIGYHEAGTPLDVSIGPADVDPLPPGTQELVDAASGAVQAYLPGHPWEIAPTCT